MTLSEKEKQERQGELQQTAIVAVAMGQIHPMWLACLQQLDAEQLDSRILEQVNSVGHAWLELIRVMDEVAREWGYDGPSLMVEGE
jgi:hypothetical protein